MKPSVSKILQGAGISSWLETLQGVAGDAIGNFRKGRPSLKKKDVAAFEKFKTQSRALATQLESASKEIKNLGLEGGWNFKGTDGKTTLENAIDALNKFATVLESTQYETIHDKPGEDVK